MNKYNIFYMVYGWRPEDQNWTFLKITRDIKKANDIVEKWSWRFDTIRVIKFDADWYGKDML